MSNGRSRRGGGRRGPPRYSRYSRFAILQLVAISLNYFMVLCDTCVGAYFIQNFKSSFVVGSGWDILRLIFKFKKKQKMRAAKLVWRSLQGSATAVCNYSSRLSPSTSPLATHLILHRHTQSTNNYSYYYYYSTTTYYYYYIHHRWSCSLLNFLMRRDSTKTTMRSP